MMENMQEDDRSLLESSVSHYRSQNFSKKEVMFLINQVKKHKDIILNKCTNTSVNQAKEVTWEKIAKEMNKQGFDCKRTADNVKVKWENLKRYARKVSKDIMDANKSYFHDELIKVLSLTNGVDEDASMEVPLENHCPPKLPSVKNSAEDVANTSENDCRWDSNDYNENNESDESNDGEDIKKRNRSMNFTPSECSLLLHLVRNEKDFILAKESRDGMAMKKVWTRITHRYNKLSPRKRTSRMLRTKFANMKKLVKYGTKYVKKERPNTVKIKFEPDVESIRTSMDTEDESDDDNKHFPEVQVEVNRIDDDSDPLRMVLNGDSGMESISHSGSFSPYENKEVVKLKLELLKYQLETAKLERQRIQEALAAETSERQSKAVEASLRLRAARLDAVASASRLPPDHPALQYTEQESLAQQYLQQAQRGINKSESDGALAATSERQSKDVEATFRLRAARFKVVASASRLPPDHPALQYTEQESLAQQYLQQAQRGINKSESVGIA